MGTMNLLAVTAPQIALIVVAVLAALAALIGFVRRFSRGSWLGMQICVLFAATFLLGKIPAFENDYVSFGVTAGAFLLAAVREGDRFSIVTTRPNASVSPVHDRMPLVLGSGESSVWLADGFERLINRGNITLKAIPEC